MMKHERADSTTVRDEDGAMQTSDTSQTSQAVQETAAREDAPGEGAGRAVAIVGEEALCGKVHEVRGQKVMLDFELAEIYGYSTKRFNEQVKNNIEKFDDDFRFQLSDEELDYLRSEKSTANISTMIRSNPYAFTEQGIYMLMTVLRGDLATRQSKALIRLFKRMKDAVEESRGLVGRREFLDLSLKVNDSLSESVRLRRDLSRVEEDVAGILDTMGDMLRESDIGEIMEDFGKATERYGYLILDGKPLEAAAAYGSIYGLARESVFVVDNYVSARTLQMLAGVCGGVTVTLFTDNKGKKLHLADVAAFEAEHPGVALQVRSAGGFVHDRFIALDYGTAGEAVYHCGASSKDAGSRATAIMRFGNPEEFHALFDRLLGQPPLDLQ